MRPETLDRMWFPHFARCLEPVLKSGVRLVWHCDGNLMDLVGLHGFQGFQVAFFLLWATTAASNGAVVSNIVKSMCM